MATPEVILMQDLDQPQEQPQQKLHIRWMIRRDMPEVLDIEQESFEDPWTEKDFLHYLRQQNCIGMVVKLGEEVIAFFIYELEKDQIRLINWAVHRGHRGQGVGKQCILKLQSKLSQHHTHIVALVPEYCTKVQLLFKKYHITVHLTKNKGKVTYQPVFSAMTKQDTEDVQTMENEVLGRHGREARKIGDLIANTTSYGIVARDKFSDILMGYVLYERDSKGIGINGEFGVIVGYYYRKRGIGRKLVQELVKQKLPITLYDVCLTCKDQCGFLQAIGVPVPKVQRFVNVEWRPEPPSS